MTKAELDRLKYETISFKDIITGGWALKYQACTVNNYNSYLFFLVDRASRRRARYVSSSAFDGSFSVPKEFHIFFT